LTQFLCPKAHLTTTPHFGYSTETTGWSGSGHVAAQVGERRQQVGRERVRILHGTEGMAAPRRPGARGDHDASGLVAELDPADDRALASDLPGGAVAGIDNGRSPLHASTIGALPAGR